MRRDYSRELVLEKLGNVFPDEALLTEALAVLDTYGHESWHRERERVQIAMLMLCEGRMESLRRLAETANRDYRDVLAGAEYPEEFSLLARKNPNELEEIRKRDRGQYEAWLRKGRQ